MSLYGFHAVSVLPPYLHESHHVSPQGPCSQQEWFIAPRFLAKATSEKRPLPGVELGSLASKRFVTTKRSTQVV
jgi:hypothetical protein